jgi:signal transduction histidine kinase
MQVVAQLTGGVAHDFNNLLTVIKANTDLMRHDAAGSSPELLRLIESVQSAAHRGEELTKSLLSFARRRAMREEVADLSADVSAIADLVRRTLPEGVRFAVEIPEERIPVRLDRTQLETAVMNVCLNARDAMDGAGELSISVATETLTEAEDDLAPGRYGVVRVRDTGPGMSPEVLSRAFEPFFTTKGVGQTGLGLAMVYGFAQQSKGSAQLESAPGGGTEVILYFPVQASGSEFGRVRLSEGLGTR